MLDASKKLVLGNKNRIIRVEACSICGLNCVGDAEIYDRNGRRICEFCREVEIYYEENNLENQET